MKNSSTPPITAWFIGLLGVVIFGATLPATKLALPDFSPWFITFARALLAAFFAYSFLFFKGKGLKHKQNLSIFLAGIFLIFGFPGFMALGLQTVPASHGGVILGCLPLATAIVASLIAAEPQSPLFWAVGILSAAVVVSFSLVNNSSGANSLHLEFGDLWLFAAVASASLGYVISGKLSRHMPGWEVICRALILNLPIIVIGTYLTFEPQFLSPSTTGFIALIYLALGSMLLGFFAWNTALAMGGIGKISQLQLLQPFITIYLSWLFISETISIFTIGAALCVVILIAISRKV